MKLEIGNRVKVSPDITGLSEWVEGIIINIRNNPFLGKEVAIKDSLGRIFFGEEKYFKTV
ncbi:MAG: hypothetical protein PUK02_02935 [Parabacteroides sp.]|nr:hypothetical protein [Parabacteroides sp.]MCI7707695.1 hypothetical protein [Parabacteroides sp.]MDD7560740.1 hypothetical protein [Parabacteroides sp.]